MSETEIEQEIQGKGLTAPRLTPEAIDDLIVFECSGQASKLFSGCPTLRQSRKLRR